ncbi:hypothetical protein CH063_05007 [Colletotrichum higginsianum]|uniref:Alpha beta hydrolase family n=1 Tax=Colletotrichum higginsianum (strain IMI 349063) TaxID=759273 RepID=H1UXG6_COLHI|nr:Alpha beta hydrolase family [Colletotrichum higginsianum IMI 349063]OBR03039.1 Alpha beta hydrolase family [Colletotrichum higginsianum IMI 349063]CCF32667.1 hypothetical protein CH063_05007 [Colletotrichum higginsianum]
MDNISLIAVTAFTTFCFLLVAYYSLYPIDPQIIPSPLHIIASLPEEEVQKLPYQPNCFPGARDVETEYGFIRVYEWGPETGPKVVLIHGMSTCTMTLGPIAEALVSRGCRVLLFDLFGRGYSDGVGDLPYDIRLYTTQVLLVLASSPLSWTGSNSLRVIGYSLGGAIAASFTVTFPHMVSSLILLAPAGLIRSTDLGLTFWFLFKSGLVPKRVLHTLMRGQLRSTANSGRIEEQHCFHQKNEEKPTDLGTTSQSVNKQSLQERTAAYMPWIVAHHRGFVPAFTSCARFSPLTNQQRVWRALGKRKMGSTAVIIGDADEFVNAAWYEKNGLPLLGGKEHVVWKVLPGSHDFVMTAPELIMREIDVLWGLPA